MRNRHRVLPALLLALVTIAATGHGERAAPTRWAVIVGISDYMNFGDEVGGDLPGAANDARAMRDVLVARWGFPEANIRMLLDHDATRAAMESALTEWLPSVVTAGDVVVFYYAGHGSQMWDTDADEEDGLDETICPTDVVSGNTERDIADDELRGWLDGIPTQHVTVILDSCHSGTATRAVSATVRPRALGRDVRRDVPRPRGVSADAGEAAGPGARDEAMELQGERVLELAATQPDQIAMDVAWPAEDGGAATYGGAFTTNLVRTLWQVPTGTTYEEIFQLTLRSVKQQRFRQTPRLSPGHPRRGEPAFTAPGLFAFGPLPLDGDAAASDAEPGEAADAEAAADSAPDAAASAASVPIVSIAAGDRTVLGGGLAAGMTEGSLYRAGRALMRITSVGPESAEASVVERGDRGIVVVRRDTFAVGAFARLVAYRYPPTRLRVSVAPLPAADRSALAGATAELPAIGLVEDSAASSDLVVERVPAGYRVLGIDGAVRHTVAAPSAAAGAAALLPTLRNELGANQLAALDNPARPFPLDFSLAGDSTRFRVGDLIGFRVRSGREGYLTIVDLGTDGTVTVLFPNALDPENRIRADEEVVVPTPAMNTEFRLAPPTGTGIVRAFVTERPLVLPFAQGDATQADLVAQALRNAAGGGPAARGEAVPVEGWATAAIVYEIVR